jgi:Tfp pilus assembly protein PilE
MAFKKNQRGFTLIETLVGSFLFIIIALMADKAFTVLESAVEFSRARVAATELANEQFEIIRNLSYGNVGVQNSIPAGSLQRTQNLTKDGWNFTVTTTVRNIDDPFDGTINSNPPDLSPADYKLAQLDITCDNCKAFSPLKFVTEVAPHDLGTASTNGALFVQVFDSNGLPVQGASVTITNNQTNPTTLIQDSTDNNGWLKIIDAPPGTNAYNIVTTKTGYSQDQTYPIGGAAGNNPVKPDSTVVQQQVTQISLSIDLLSTLNVTTEDATCTALPNIAFSLTGTKLIGTPSILKYPLHSFNTDSSGSTSISPLEWDTYSVALTSAGYDLAGTNLLPSFNLAAGTTQNLSLVAVPHIANAVLIAVKDQNGAAVNGATVTIAGGSINNTAVTGSGNCGAPGEVFWNGLPSGTYNITVSQTGYQNFSGTVNASTPWSEDTITLTPQ